MASLTTDFSSAFAKFAKVCPTKAMDSFTSMQNTLENPLAGLQKPWDIYFLYLNAMGIAKETAASNDLKSKTRFISLLNTLQDTNYNGCYKLDFLPILEIMNQGITEWKGKPEIIDSQNDLKVQEAAIATHSLMQEGIGLSFEVNWISKRIQSKESLCIITRNQQNEIIASALGTNLSVLNNKVFYFNVLVRSPKYPFIHFTSMLQAFEIDLPKNFNPDFLALCVDANNPAKKIYEKVGFEQVSEQYNQTLKQNALFMVKDCRNGNKEKPSFAEVRSALDLINQKTNSS